MKMSKKLLQQLLFIALILFSLCSCQVGTKMEQISTPISTPYQPVCVNEGCLSPNFRLETITGEFIELYKLQGYPVIINFWATWCGYCVSEMPDIEDIFGTYKDQGLIILGVNEEETLSEAKTFANDHQLTFPILLDTDGSVYSDYQVQGLPTSFFIDENGIIQKIIIGSISKDDILGIISTNLNIHSSQNLNQSMSTIEGCVNTNVLNVRMGPSTDSTIYSGLARNECRFFDARTSDNSWLRLSNDFLSDTGMRLWVAAKYIDLQENIEYLPIDE